MPKNSKSNKRKREESEEEEAEEEETFTVEVLTKARVGDDGGWEYRVKWAGYGSDEDTWEPEECVAGCARLLSSFWFEIGVDDGDYQIGTVVEPSEKWIRKERKRFKADFADGQDEKRKERERAERRKEEKLAAKKAAKKIKPSETASIPSRSASTTSVSRRATHKSVPSYSAPVPSTSAPPKKKNAISGFSDSSDSDDDRPLANLKKRKIPPKAVSANSANKTESTDNAPKSAPIPTPPVTSLFSPSPPSSPEISLSSLRPDNSSTDPKPKAAAPKSKGADRPTLSVNTGKAAPSPSLPSATKSIPLPLPKPSLPLPSRRTTSSNASSGSSTFPSRPLPSGSKPATPSIPPANKPATPTIPFSKPATPTIPPPAIQRKGSAPSRGVQFLNAPDHSAASSGSGLSTKQRLSQAALALAPAKEAPKKSNLSGLSFKKKSVSTATLSIPNPPTASGSASRIRPPPPPKRKTVDPLFDADPDEPSDLFDPPMDMDLDMNEGSPILPPALSRRPSSQANLNAQADLPPALSRRPSQASLNAQADDILKDMIPPKLPAPSSATTERQDGPNPPRFLGGYKSKMPPPKIPKKWKWTGKLLAELADKTDHFCDIVLNDLVPSTLTEGLRINAVMASVDSIHLLSFHDLVDMSEFLKTCVVIKDEPSHQLARLGPSTDKDAEPLKILARYMTKKSFVSLVPVFLDESLAGHLLLFPPVMKILIQIFHVPSELAKSSALVAALLPWKVFPEESRRPFSLLPQRPKSPIPSRVDWKKNMGNSKYQLGLRILKFPSTLHEWMSKSNRPYCIWPPSGDQKAPQDIETGYLLEILTRCGAKKVSFKSDIRAIFVHVGALKSIRKLPLLVDRRSQTCSIRFYTYGTHETVHPEHWGIREIYPFGGVVTFTPSALYEDPWGVLNTMKFVEKHPLWTCYILPSVLGMATKLSSPEEDPLAAFDRGVFVFELLLKAIDEGEVSLLRAPPLDRNARKDSDPAADWLRDHWVTRPFGPRRVLEFCMDAFSAKYSNVPKEQWVSAIESEISEDLDLMQRQPDIMKHYRRYVVIRAEGDGSLSADRDGFEWITNSDFSFNDDPQKVGA
ncbi:hypothetical protein FB451DRAFT_1276767 [Mycena latifolia]|nr:hypothetical protein FB451DRAFT_1276767 [Mycena latifolia]